MIRAQTVERLKEGDIADRRRIMARASRTLDALHLASALRIRIAVPDLAVLSFDDSIRKAATELGFEAFP